MRLVDYKTKLFGFVAENLRRLAELLSVEAAEKEISAPLAEQKTLSPMEDWLEKTRNLSPENWVGFTVENEPEPIRENEFETETDTTKTSFVDEGEADFVLEKPKKQTPVKTFFENEREAAAKSSEISRNLKTSNKTANETEISLTEKPKKPKSDSRFLSFKFPGKKRKEENAEAVQRASEISRQSPPENEKTLETAKRNFRLFPAETASQSKSETAESSATDIVNFSENQPPKFEVSTFAGKKSAAIKIEKLVTEKPKNAVEKPEAIVKKTSARREIASDRMQISNKFPILNFRKSDDASDAEISFRFPKQKTDAADVFSPKAKSEAPGNSAFPANREKNKTAVQEYFSLERSEKNGEKNGDAEKFAVAASPWIDLPDETVFAAADDIQTNFSENERLRFLESEQAGKA